MSTNGLRKFNHHPSGMKESFLGDYYYDTDVDAFIRTQQAEIERLKSQRTELIRELKWTVAGLDDYYYDHAAEQVEATRALIAEIEAEK